MHDYTAYVLFSTKESQIICALSSSSFVTLTTHLKLPVPQIKKCHSAIAQLKLRVWIQSLKMQ